MQSSKNPEKSKYINSLNLLILNSFSNKRLALSNTELHRELSLILDELSLQELNNELISLSKSGFLLNIKSNKQVWAITSAGQRFISSYRLGVVQMLQAISAETGTQIKSDNLGRLYFELTEEESVLLSDDEIAAPKGYMIATINKQYTPARVYIIKTEPVKLIPESEHSEPRTNMI